MAGMKRLRPTVLVAFVAAFATGGVASATPITYDVNYSFPTFTVNGTITTDGHTGVLTTADIVDWNLLLNDGSTTLDLEGPGSGNNSGTDIVGPDVVASLTAITYNFTDPSFDALIFQHPSVGSGNNFLCYQGVGGGCNDFNGAHIAILIGSDATMTFPESGVQVIATTAVPEPASLVLLGTGLVATVSRFRRRKRL